MATLFESNNSTDIFETISTDNIRIQMNMQTTIILVTLKWSSFPKDVEEIGNVNRNHNTTRKFISKI